MNPLHEAMARLDPLRRALVLLTHVLDLGIRLYVARAFFLSGLTKIRDWDTTLLLFSDEYHVPLLPTELAAFAGTAGELVFPVLLALGLATRLSAFGLGLVNVMAVVSYWHVLGQEDAAAALSQHVYWGVLLLVPLLHGPGRLSLDALVWRRPGMPATAAG
jgi:putative oxidoreductase